MKNFEEFFLNLTQVQMEKTLLEFETIEYWSTSEEEGEEMEEMEEGEEVEEGSLAGAQEAAPPPPPPCPGLQQAHAAQ